MSILFLFLGKIPQQIVAKGLVYGSLMFDASDKQAFYEYGKYERFYKKDKYCKDIIKGANSNLQSKGVSILLRGLVMIQPADQVGF